MITVPIYLERIRNNPALKAIGPMFFTNFRLQQL
jgi:hypothetical protein